MNKYDVRFFPNGRMVFIDWSDIENVVKLGKELLVVCNCWSGGYAIAIGANDVTGWYGDDKQCWEVYSYDVQDIEFTTDKLNKFYKVIFTSGEKIIMQTGDEATAYFGHIFSDWDTKYNVYKNSFRNHNHNYTETEFESLRHKVDVKATIAMLSNEDKEEKSKIIQEYLQEYLDR